MAENIRTKLIIDASAVLCRLLPDETSNQEVKKVFRKYEKEQLELVAPELLYYEVGNVLKSTILSKRASLEVAQLVYDRFFDLEIQYVRVNFKEVLPLAISEGISFYDASYLFLSRKFGVGLLTLDKKLMRLVR